MYQSLIIALNCEWPLYSGVFFEPFSYSCGFELMNPLQRDVSGVCGLLMYCSRYEDSVTWSVGGWVAQGSHPLRSTWASSTQLQNNGVVTKAQSRRAGSESRGLVVEPKRDRNVGKSIKPPPESPGRLCQNYPSSCPFLMSQGCQTPRLFFILIFWS